MLNLESIRRKAESRFHAFLLHKLDTELFHGESAKAFFPWEIPAGREFQSASSAVSEPVQKNLKELYRHSKQSQGKGYALVFETVDSRKMGSQTCLKKAVFETEDDYLAFLKRHRDVTRFIEHARIVYQQFPGSEMWLRDSVNRLLQDRTNEMDYWQNICLCVHWLLDHPSSNLYVREIPLPVHTKFIEWYKHDIFSLVRFKRAIQIDERLNFEELGLKSDEPFIRFRLGDADQGLPLSVFKNFYNEVIKEVFVIENKMVYLTFPKSDHRLCIFGSGFQAASLSVCTWLSSMPLFYFGDLDEHGFRILSQFRNCFHHVKSFCMDTAVLNHFDQYRTTGSSVQEDAIQNLSEDEQQVFSRLRNDPTRNRLEQERIPLSYISEQLASNK